MTALMARTQQAEPRSGLIGDSGAMRDVRATLAVFSDCDAPVLLEGETGTGKELAARALHYLSVRRGEPFVPINCAALPEALVVNELFGHRRGAFTGAERQEAGLIEQARRGTILFDEVDTLALPAQAVLLRFLQDQEYRPLGGGDARTAAVRIVSATNAGMAGKVKAASFRQDLFYRLGVLTLRLPPLRERREDILSLARHFLARLRQRYGGPARDLSQRALDLLEAHDWPGNVRELENRLHRAFILSSGREVDWTDLGLGGGSGRDDRPILGPKSPFGTFATAKARVVADFEQDYLSRLMSLTHGNISAASRVARKERRTLARLLKKHGIDRREYAAGPE